MPNPMDAILSRISEGNRRRQENALNEIFAKSYEPGAAVPFVDEGAQAFGLPQEPGMVAGYEPGRINEHNALSQMAQSKEPGFALQALKFQREMDDRKAEQERLRQTGLTASRNTMPMDVQETQWFTDPRRTPEEKAIHLTLKRAQQIMNLGGTQAVLDPLSRQISQSFAVTPKQTETPEYQGAQAQATVAGKAAGEQESSLVEMQSNLPRLETVVGQLSELGKTATYTKAGQAQDFSRRELGFEPRKEAIARKEYISKVDNEVLPLLRQTFGSAFTEKEGTSLKATLGDPNASPAEKEAVLKSFIDSKRAEVATQRRKVGLTDTPVREKEYAGVTDVTNSTPPKESASKPKAGAIDSGFVFLGGDPGNPKNWKKAK